jgi:hypothetical protein
LLFSGAKKKWQKICQKNRGEKKNIGGWLKAFENYLPIKIKVLIK